MDIRKIVLADSYFQTRLLLINCLDDAFNRLSDKNDKTALSELEDDMSDLIIKWSGEDANTRG